jgi:hypothetical protein
VENFKLGLVFLSVFLNFYLISELKRQSSVQNVSLENLGARIQTMVSAQPAAAGADKSISNSALMDMVNTAVHDEMARVRPSAGLSAVSDSQRLDQLQARLETLQNGLSEKAAGGGGKEKKLKEEAQKLKQEILAACTKK